MTTINFFKIILTYTYKRKLKDFVMIEKIVLIGLSLRKQQSMEGVIEMVEKAIEVTLIEREDLIQIDM